MLEHPTAMKPCCRVCRPDLFPKGTRRGEGHVAVRFGDNLRGNVEVVFNGRVVTEGVSEALAGEHGWIVQNRDLYGQQWLCTCKGEAVEEIRYGKVEVKMYPDSGDLMRPERHYR